MLIDSDGDNPLLREEQHHENSGKDWKHTGAFFVELTPEAIQESRSLSNSLCTVVPNGVNLRDVTVECSNGEIRFRFTKFAETFCWEMSSLKSISWLYSGNFIWQNPYFYQHNTTSPPFSTQGLPSPSVLLPDVYSADTLPVDVPTSIFDQLGVSEVSLGRSDQLPERFQSKEVSVFMVLFLGVWALILFVLWLAGVF